MEKSIIAVLLIGAALIGYTTISNYFTPEEIGACSCDSIEDMVAWAEGKKACVYKDSLGIPTIGIGFNLKRSDARSVCSRCGVDYDAIYSGSKCLSDSQISCLFNYDLSWAQDGARSCVPSYYSHHRCIQNVLVDMTFNMGKTSLCGWPNFVKQLGNKDYQGAATNMKSTKWCGQVGRRCTRNVVLVQSC